MQARSKYFVLTTELLLPLGIILFFILAIYLSLFSPLFSVTEIECELDYQPCTNEILTAELATYQGENLLRFPAAKLQNRLLSGDFTLREVELTRRFPHTLVLNLLSSYPVVALRLQDETSKWLTFDQAYRVIAVRDSDPNVATLTVEQAPAFQLGQPLADQDLVSSLQLTSQLAKELTSLDTLSLTGDSTLILDFAGGLRALLTTDKPLAPQLTKLQSLLADQEVKREYRLIDVRFDQPVLKTIY